jgi:hypothetical protein
MGLEYATRHTRAAGTGLAGGLNTGKGGRGGLLETGRVIHGKPLA